MYTGAGLCSNGISFFIDLASSETPRMFLDWLLDAAGLAVGHVLIGLFRDWLKPMLVALSPPVVGLLRDHLLWLGADQAVSLVLGAEVLNRILSVNSNVEWILLLRIIPDRRGVHSCQVTIILPGHIDQVVLLSIIVLHIVISSRVN
jgi:hypothetical protein